MSAPKHLDLGRLVQHFGEWYLWSVSPTGNLALVSVERVNASMRELNEAMRSARLGSVQPDESGS